MFTEIKPTTIRIQIPKTVTKRQRKALELRDQGLELAEIGEQLGVTKAAAGQLIGRAIKNIDRAAASPFGTLSFWARKAMETHQVLNPSALRSKLITGVLGPGSACVGYPVYEELCEFVGLKPDYSRYLDRLKRFRERLVRRLENLDEQIEEVCQRMKK